MMADDVGTLSIRTGALVLQGGKKAWAQPSLMSIKLVNIGPGDTYFSENQASATVDLTIDQDSDGSSGSSGRCNTGASFSSTDFAVGEEDITKLTATQCKLEVWCGSEKVGTASFSLELALTGLTEQQIVLPLGEPLENNGDSNSGEGMLASNGSTSTLEVTLSVNDATSDYCIGSSVVRITGGSVTRLPSMWHLSHPSLKGLEEEALNAKIAELMRGPALHSYAASLAPATQAQQESSTLPPPFIPMKLNGTLKLSEGVWSIDFPAPEGGIIAHLHRSQFRVLREAVKSGSGQLNLTLDRTPVVITESEDPKAKKQPIKKGKDAAPVEPETPPELSWITGATISLQALGASPGLRTATLTSPLVHQSGGEEDPEERKLAISTAGTTFSLTVTMSNPIVRDVVGVSKQKLAVIDVAPVADLRQPKPPRDVEQELRDELDAYVKAVLLEYTKLFGNAASGGAGNLGGTGNGRRSVTNSVSGGTSVVVTPPPQQNSSQFQHAGVSVDEMRRQLFYALTTSGTYHKFKEALKPRIQRVVRKRYGEGAASSVEIAAGEGDQFAAQLYLHLIQEANSVLVQRLKDVEVALLPSYTLPDPARELADKVAELGVLAMDSEAAGDAVRTLARHQDRIDIATQAASSPEDKGVDDMVACTGRRLLVVAWWDMAQWCLRREDHNRALHALRETLRCSEATGSQEYGIAMQLYGALSQTTGQIEVARSVLEDAVCICMPVETKDVQERDGYDTDDYSVHCPYILSALLCIVYDMHKKPKQARAALRRAVAAYLLQEKNEKNESFMHRKESIEGKKGPRRTAVSVMLALCKQLVSYKLWGLAGRALAAAEECEKVTVAKATSRGLPNTSSTELRAEFLRLRSTLNLHAGMFQEAESSAFSATELAPQSTESWETLAAVYAAQGLAVDQAAAVAEALARYETATSTYGAPPAPLSLYVAQGQLYHKLGQLEESKAVFISAASAWPACPSPWYGAGIACLRLEQFSDAEEALHRANRLDPRCPKIWGTLSLLLLLQGETRLTEALAALGHATRLGLSDSSLLRELGNCFVSIDRLEEAEDMLRRALGAETEGAFGGAKANVRRRLADVLSAQNSLSQAVEQYRLVINTQDAPEQERVSAYERCVPILKTLGRDEELAQLSLLIGGM